VDRTVERSSSDERSQNYQSVNLEEETYITISLLTLNLKGCGIGGRIRDFDGFAAAALQPFVLVEILESAGRCAAIREKVGKRHLVALTH
jgi:hypothetical protein